MSHLVTRDRPASPIPVPFGQHMLQMGGKRRIKDYKGANSLSRTWGDLLDSLKWMNVLLKYMSLPDRLDMTCTRVNEDVQQP